MKKFRNIFLSLVVSSTLAFNTSCVSETGPECEYGFMIDLTYHTINTPQTMQDQGAQVVRVFLYNINGQYVKTHSVSIDELAKTNYRINVPIEQPGAYRFVVLGDAQTAYYNITSGTIESYDVSLVQTAQDTQIENMFATTSDSVTVFDGEFKLVEKDSFKNNNEIQLSIEGVDGVTVKNIKLEVKDRNYNQFNKITSGDNIIYSPFNGLEFPDYTFMRDTVKFSKMRIMSLSQNTYISFDLYRDNELWYSQEPMDISTYIYDYVKNSERYAEIRKDDNYQYLLDIEHTFPITFRYKVDEPTGDIETLVAILIRDWDVHFVTPLPL